VPEDKRKSASLAHIAGEGDRLGDPCDALAAIYESMYGKVPNAQAHARGVRAARVREDSGILGLPVDADWGERMAAAELLNEPRK